MKTDDENRSNINKCKMYLEKFNEAIKTVDLLQDETEFELNKAEVKMKL